MSFPTHIIVVRNLSTNVQTNIEYRANPGETDAFVVALARDLYGTTLEEIHRVKEVVLDTINLEI